MDQELLMKQIVEQVMHAMQNGGSAPAAPGGKITAAGGQITVPATSYGFFKI